MEAYKPIVDKAVAYGNAHEGSTEEKVEKTVDKMFVLFGAEILKVVPGMTASLCTIFTIVLTFLGKSCNANMLLLHASVVHYSYMV